MSTLVTIITMLFVVFVIVIVTTICRTMKSAFTLASKDRYNPKDDEDWIKSLNDRKNPYV